MRSVPRLVRAKTRQRPVSLASRRVSSLLLAVDGNLEGLHANVFGGLEDGAEREAHRVPHVVLYEMHDRGFQRCREAHGLALFRQDRCDPANGGKKSHVQHAVGFVENQDVQIRGS